jgi:putative secretion ATPase (PEP-CTERM system associated)
MYESFFNLRERPFSLSPDPDYLYLSRVHREALDSLRYGIESRTGFMVVTGDIGAGKTTLLQSLLRRLDERTTIARLVNTALEPRELLEAIVLDFGLDATGKSKPVLLRDLGQFLCEQRAQGRRPLLIIDEAQNLTAAALEEVRLLSNLETEKSKLLQILIVGQPNLRDMLAAPELEQFRQRVAVSYHLSPLDSAETAAYIDFRLRHAAIGEPPRFPTDASAEVHRRSRGVPRVINMICDAALLCGYAEDKRHIDRALIDDTVAELEASGILSGRHPSRRQLRQLRRRSPATRSRGSGAASHLPPRRSPPRLHVSLSVSSGSRNARVSWRNRARFWRSSIAPCAACAARRPRPSPRLPRTHVRQRTRASVASSPMPAVASCRDGPNRPCKTNRGVALA